MLFCVSPLLQPRGLQDVVQGSDRDVAGMPVNGNLDAGSIRVGGQRVAATLNYHPTCGYQFAFELFSRHIHNSLTQYST